MSVNPGSQEPAQSAAMSGSEFTEHDLFTPELEKHFEKTGEYLVQEQVLHLMYVAPDKRRAAMIWLAKKRKRKTRLEFLGKIFAIAFAIAGTLGGAYLGASINSSASVELKARETKEARAALLAVLIGDINALKQTEEQKFVSLKLPLQKLISVDALKRAGGRAWLMAPSPMIFPVFEQNAGKLGLLPSPLPETIATFYGHSYSLRSQINLVTGPAIIAAAQGERKHAVEDYERAYQDWKVEAEALLYRLALCCAS